MLATYKYYPLFGWCELTYKSTRATAMVLDAMAWVVVVAGVGAAALIFSSRTQEEALPLVYVYFLGMIVFLFTSAYFALGNTKRVPQANRLSTALLMLDVAGIVFAVAMSYLAFVLPHAT